MWKEPKKWFDQKFIKSTVKYGKGSVMLWGCFSSKGVGNLIFIDDIMDKFLYLDILRDNLGSRPYYGTGSIYFSAR